MKNVSSGEICAAPGKFHKNKVAIYSIYQQAVNKPFFSARFSANNRESRAAIFMAAQPIDKQKEIGSGGWI